MKKRSITMLVVFMMMYISFWLVIAKNDNHVEAATSTTTETTETTETTVISPELRKAVDTIFRKYPNITVGEAYNVKGNLLHYTTHGEDGKQIKMITPIEYSLDEDEDISFLFLTSEDTNVVEATESDINFFYNEVDIDPAYKLPQNQNIYNYNEDAFAFSYKKDVHVIVENSSVSSIWTLNHGSNQISLYYKAD